MITYLLALYDNEKSDDNKSEADMAALMGEYQAFTESIKASGNYIGGEALHPTSTASTVRVRDGKRATTDGPFAETKEQLGGYYIIDVPSVDEAVKWAAKIPSANGGAVEIRPLDANPGT
jgi:hypothetical protein